MSIKRYSIYTHVYAISFGELTHSLVGCKSTKCNFQLYENIKGKILKKKNLFILMMRNSLI